MSDAEFRELAWPLQPGDVPNIADLMAMLADEIDARATGAGGACALIEAPLGSADDLARLAERLAELWEDKGLTCLVVDAHPAAPFLGELFDDGPEGFSEMLHYGISPEIVALSREGAAGMWIPAGAPWSLPLESPEEPVRSLRRLAEQANRVIFLASSGDEEGLLSDLRAECQYRLLLNDGSSAADTPAQEVAAQPAQATAEPSAAGVALNELSDEAASVADEIFGSVDDQADSTPANEMDELAAPVSEATPPGEEEDEHVIEIQEAGNLAELTQIDVDTGDLSTDPVGSESPEREVPIMEEAPVASGRQDEAAMAEDPPISVQDNSPPPAKTEDEPVAAEASTPVPNGDAETEAPGEKPVPTVSQVMPFDVSVDDKDYETGEEFENAQKNAQDDAATGAEDDPSPEGTEPVAEDAGEKTADEDVSAPEGFDTEGFEDSPEEFDLAAMARKRRRRFFVAFASLAAVALLALGFTYVQRNGFSLPGSDSAVEGQQEMLAAASNRLPERAELPYHSGSLDSVGSGETPPLQAGLGSGEASGSEADGDERNVALEGIQLDPRPDHEGRWLGEGRNAQSGAGQSGAKTAIQRNPVAVGGPIDSGQGRQQALASDDRSGSARAGQALSGSSIPTWRSEKDATGEQDRSSRAARLYLDNGRKNAPKTSAGVRRRMESRATWRSVLDHDGSFLVHVESYQDSSLGAWSARRQGLGESAYILQPALIKGVVWYRLCVGPFGDLATATAYRDSLLDRAGEHYSVVLPNHRE